MFNNSKNGAMCAQSPAGLCELKCFFKREFAGNAGILLLFTNQRQRKFVNIIYSGISQNFLSEINTGL